MNSLFLLLDPEWPAVGGTTARLRGHEAQMTAFQVYDNGIDMGRFDKPSEFSAIYAYACSLGYDSILAAAEALDKTVGEFLAGITVEQIKN